MLATTIYSILEGEKEDNELLFKAARSGTAAEVKAALEKTGSRVNAKGGFEITVVVDNYRGDRERREITVEYSPLMQAAQDNADLAVTMVLLEAGAKVNVKDEYGATPLLKALRWNKNPEVAKALLKAGADVNAQDQNGDTPLLLAAKFEGEEMVKALMKAGATVNVKNRYGETPLMWAAMRIRDIEIINKMLEAGANKDGLDSSGRTMLMYAACNPNFEIFKMFLSPESDVNAKDKDGRTALMRASRNPTLEVTKGLLQAGADVNAKVEDRLSCAWDGCSPLEIAVSFNENPEVTRTLIKAGADVNAKNLYGATPLMYAAKGGGHPLMYATSGEAKTEAEKTLQTEVVKILLEAGAKINAKNVDGYSPLSIAVRWNENAEMTKTLIKAGANVKEKNEMVAWDRLRLKHNRLQRLGLQDSSDDEHYSSSLLMVAARFNKNPDVARALIKAGLKVNEADEKGRTPLMEAVSGGNLEAIKALLEAGADPNSSDTNGTTPLMLAADRTWHPEIFKTLLAAGADKNLRDSKGKRAVDYFKKEWFKEELSFLRYEPEFKEGARKTLKMLK